MPATTPNRQVIWNEEIHTFEPIGFNRFCHYSRPVWSHSTKDDRPTEPRFLYGYEVDEWIKARSLPPIDETLVQQELEQWERGNFGPLDNPRKDQKPESE